MKYDFLTCNVRDIPMTEAKRDIIDASKSPIDVWINDHYDELVKGMICSSALVCKPSDMKDKNFQLSIKDKCDRKQKRIDGKRVWCYFLKDECKGLYHQTEYNDEEFSDE